MFREQLNHLAELALKANPPKNGDYICPDDGLIYCGRCHTPKQCRITTMGQEMVMPCMCKCRSEEVRAEQEMKKSAEREAARKKCFDGCDLINATFERDDCANEKLSRLCRAYVKKFSPSIRWLVLHGGCGTGKSFAAACIVNELINRDYSARFVTISQIEARIFGSSNKSQILDELSRVDILCIDDFGAERDTEYMNQIAFDIIDRRLRSGRPCIITTNISPQEFCSPKNLGAKRIYSRILGNAAFFTADGVDRRTSGFRQNNRSYIEELLRAD